MNMTNQNQNSTDGKGQPLARIFVSARTGQGLDVLRQALAHNAAAVILAHNHPSGVAEPSQADELITARLRDALALVDIRVLDHLVVGGSTVTSLAERGLI